MASNPTIVLASLDDKELKQSISKLVNYFDDQMKIMAASANITVDSIEKKLKSLGNIKIDSGGAADGGSSRRTSKLKEEETQVKATTQAYKEQSTTLDQQAAAIRKANQVSVRTGDAGSVRNADTLQTMNIQLDLLRERLREARNQYSSFIALASHATTTGDKGLYQFATDGVHKYGDEVRTLIPQIRGLQNAIQQMGDVIAPQGHTIQNYVNSLQKTNPELALLNEQFKKGQSELQNQSTSYSNATQSARQYTEEIRKQAQAIRESQQWKEKGYATVNGVTLYNLEKDTTPLKSRISLEEQLLQLHKSEESSMMQQAAGEEKVAQATRLTEEELKKVYQDQKRINDEINKRASGVRTGGSTPFQSYDSLRQSIASVLGIQEQQVKMANAEKDSYNQLSSTLKQLRQAYDALGKSDRNSDQGKALVASIHEVERAMQKIRSQAARPVSLESIIGINRNGGLSEKTIDDIAYKMQRLASYRSGLNVETQKKEISTVNAEYDRLKKKMDEVMQKNQSMIASNTALGRSWNYMKNRLAFYFTVGASTSFVKQLIDIRGQYELLDRSIGILIDSAQNGSQIFAELNAMAIKSPFTTMELGAAAKQLVAYDVAAKDVVDTTRRLADMAAAVGIPIERLTYALGQIKAYGYLNARDARMFANAGIPLVKELADYYTELEGRLVSTADVYDRIKKKAIDYSDVMSVVNKMTDEGGKFFDFQEKAADTLKVRIANLTLAWNNMLNEMGKDNQGILTEGLKVTKQIFESWRDINNMVVALGLTYGTIKAAQIAYYLWVMRTEKAVGAWSKIINAIDYAFNAKIANVINSLKTSLVGFFTNPAAMLSVAFTALSVALTKAYLDYRDLQAANEEFNKSVVKNAEENVKSIDKFFGDYKKQLESVGSLNSADQTKLWERVQEEIEKTTKNAEKYIEILNKIPEVSRRIEVGESVLEQSKRIQDELKYMAERGMFNVGGGFANDSAAKDLQQYSDAINELITKYGDLDNAKKEALKVNEITLESGEVIKQYTGEYADFQRAQIEAEKELQNIVSTLDKVNMAEILGTGDMETQLANVRSFAIAWRDAFLATEKGSKISAEGQALLNSYIDKWIEQQARVNHLIKDENTAAVEANRTAWETFFKFLNTEERKRLDVAIKTNQLGSKSVQELWDNAAERMQEKATTSYNLIQQQIADLRNTPDIVINVVYRNNKEKLEKDQEEFEKKYIQPKDWGVLSTDEYLKQEKANREKYGTLMRKQGEDTAEYEKRISDERKSQLELQKKNGDIIEENKNKTDDFSRAVTEQAKKEKQAADDRLKVIKEVEDAGGYDFSTKSERAAANKAAKQAESELAKALKDELSTIDKVRSIYKDLTKEGMSHANAVERATKGWDETVNAINKVLQKNGLKKLNLADFVGVENPREMMNTLQSQLESMVKRGASSSEIKVIQEKIRTLEVDADKYDLTKITKGLNNELDRLKEEYELAVALDADPELGSMFADWMGIDMSELPKTASEYAEKATSILNKKLGELGSKTELPNLLNITDDDMRAFEANKTFTDKQLELIKKAVEIARGYQRKETEDRIKDWDKLLEKYAEYEVKVNKIHNDAVKERVTFAQQFGSEEDKSLALNLQTQILAATDPQEKQKLIQQLQELVKSIAGDDKTKVNLITSIDNSEQRGVAKANFEEFQKSPEWITATGDLAGMTTKAIGYLISSLERYKKTAKNLDPKQIKQINSALRSLHRQQRQGNPFLQIADAIDRAKARAEEFQPEMDAVMSDIISLEKEIGDNDPTEEQAKHLQTLKERWKDLAAQGEVSATEYVEAINASIAAASQAIGMFTDMAEALGGKHMTEAAQTIRDVTGILEKAGQGAAMGAQIGGGWGALIGGVAGGLAGVITTFAEQWSGNKAITNNIKESEKAVRQLELAMKSLEHTSDDAFGAIVVGSKQSIKATKELQLAELRRQLALEQSRSSKYKDEERISELQGQILDLEYEVKHATSEIVNDLLGISSHEDFFEGLISDMINAFKSGEDAMEVFKNKWAEMIDSMVVKMILGQVLQQWVNNLEIGATKIVDKYTKKLSEQVAEQENVIQGMQSMDAGDITKTLYYTQRDLFDKIINQLGVEAPKEGWISEILWFEEAWESGISQKISDVYMEMLKNGIDGLQDQISKKSLDATDELIDYYTEEGKAFGEQIKDIWPQLMEQFGYKYGQDADAGLSALQQGIQGITEDTAGAIEAYMNGVSQQVYYQSDILTQIRDILIGGDGDVQLGVQAQMLLQLQQSYQVQMSIQGILEGWSSPNGMAVRVQLES